VSDDSPSGAPRRRGAPDPGNAPLCHAVETLAWRMDPATFMFAFGEHVAACRRCRSLLAGPALRLLAHEFLRSIGRPRTPGTPTAASILCEQIEFLAHADGQRVDPVSFGRAFGAHILDCPRCRTLVPRRITPETLTHAIPPPTT